MSSEPAMAILAARGLKKPSAEDYSGPSSTRRRNSEAQNQRIGLPKQHIATENAACDCFKVFDVTEVVSESVGYRLSALSCQYPAMSLFARGLQAAGIDVWLDEAEFVIGRARSLSLEGSA
jgi:hypothetical protein